MSWKVLGRGQSNCPNKIKEGCPPDNRPVAVDETLSRLVGKCVCALLKDKTADFFQPWQLGAACWVGAEKIAHGVRSGIKEHWMDEDNAFMMSSPDRQYWMNVLLSSRAFTMGVLVWPIPHYGTHLARSFQNLECPLLFALVLQKLVSSLEADDKCFDLFQAWFLDNQALAGRSPSCVASLAPNWGDGTYTGPSC